MAVRTSLQQPLPPFHSRTAGKIEARQVACKSGVPQTVLNKLRSAILASPFLEEEAKTLLC